MLACVISPIGKVTVRVTVCCVCATVTKSTSVVSEDLETTWDRMVYAFRTYKYDIDNIEFLASAPGITKSLAEPMEWVRGLRMNSALLASPFWHRSSTAQYNLSSGCSGFRPAKTSVRAAPRC